MSDAAYDLVVIGGNAGGLSVAVALQQSGLSRVRILEETSAVAFPELVGEFQLDAWPPEAMKRHGAVYAMTWGRDTDEDDAESRRQQGPAWPTATLPCPAHPERQWPPCS